MYKYEIGRLLCQLFTYKLRLPTPTFFRPSPSSTLVYYEHPGGFFSPDPYNHLSAPYIDPYVESSALPTDGWNTTAADWDTLPTAIFRSRALSHLHISSTSGTLPTATSLSSISHIPDVVREDNVPSEGTSGRESFVSAIDPPPTVHAPYPQQLPTVSPNREWSSRLEETLHSLTTHLASSLLGLDPQAQMSLPRVSIKSSTVVMAPSSPTDQPMPHAKNPRLSPITLGSTRSPTLRSPVLPPLTIPTNPALSLRHASGMSSMESLAEDPPLPPLP
ncbi:hypothetical protein ARMSODRAFT_1013585 [Armillaria solidipes]|uniref:Uncharacterized protein n=1 Tax=Armillaria solidipes TaxID=1076256 RepID=A0A2H3BY97_9AGAR|nr:hypothetical protein ARMSODRAFT_1013585 [Armillaria solidipes]